MGLKDVVVLQIGERGRVVKFRKGLYKKEKFFLAREERKGS